MHKDIKLVCFDLNRTLIGETWLPLNLAMGMSLEEDAALVAAYGRGEITYPQWVSELCRLYRLRGKCSREAINNTIFAYEYLPGARETVSYLKQSGYKLALISGAMTQLIEKIAEELGFDYCRAVHELVFDQNGNLADITTAGADEIAKANFLREICEQAGIPPKQCACVGDGDNDRLLFELTGRGITFKGSKLEPIAWKVIEKLDDIKAIL